MENKQKLVRNSILYMMAMVFPKVAGFIIIPIYTRYIVPEEYGIFFYTTSIIGVTMVFSSLGMGTFYFRNYNLEHDKKEFNGTMFWSLLIWNIILLFFNWFILSITFNLLNTPFSFYPYMLLALITQFLNSIEIIPMRTFRVKGEVYYYLIRILLKTLLNIGLGLYFIIELQMGVIGIFYAEVISAFVFAIIFLFYMFNNSYFNINLKLFKKAFKFSLPLIPSDLLLLSAPLIINVIIERTLSLAQLGIYSIGISIASVVKIITSSVSMSIEPVLYNYSSKEDFPKFFLNLKNITIGTVGIFCIGIGLFIREISMLLLSEKYWSAWPIVQIILISYIISTMKDMLGKLIIIEGRTTILLLSNLSYLITNILICIATLPLWGEYALGWSNLIGFLFALIIIILNIKSFNLSKLNLLRDFFMIFLGYSLFIITRLLHHEFILLNISIKIILFIMFSLIVMRLYHISPKLVINVFLRKKVSV